MQLNSRKCSTMNCWRSWNIPTPFFFEDKGTHQEGLLLLSSRLITTSNTDLRLQQTTSNLNKTFAKFFWSTPNWPLPQILKDITLVQYGCHAMAQHYHEGFYSWNSIHWYHHGPIRNYNAQIKTQTTSKLQSAHHRSTWANLFFWNCWPTHHGVIQLIKFAKLESTATRSL